MGLRNAVSVLPADIRLQLHKRLVDSNFSGYEELSNWLLTLGYSIGKSSLHRYSIVNELKIRSSILVLDTYSEGTNNSSLDIRMRCLELSSGFVTDGNFELLTKKADELFQWVCAG